MYNKDMDIGQTAIVLVIVIGVTFVSMVLHELMHGLTAYWLGDDTAKINGRLTLNPLAHIDPFLTIILPALLVLANGAGMNAPIFGGAKPVPFNPDKVKGGEWGAALVGIVGPLTNLVLAFICFVIWSLLPAGSNQIIELIFRYGVSVNLGFFAFNILPIPPLDGSRLLYAVAPEGVQRLMDRIEQVGIMVVFVIVMVASPVIGQILSYIISGVLYGFSWIIHLFSIS